MCYACVCSAGSVIVRLALRFSLASHARQLACTSASSYVSVCVRVRVCVCVCARKEPTEENALGVFVRAGWGYDG